MTPLNIHRILENLPHRYPFLLVDRVLSYEVGKSLDALKNVTINEPFFAGHFPHFPVMPGVLILEALAQACALLASVSSEAKLDGELYYFAGIDNARFKRPVSPGDQLRLHVELERQMRGVYRFHAQASVEGELAAEAQLICAKRPIQK